MAKGETVFSVSVVVQRAACGRNFVTFSCAGMRPEMSGKTVAYPNDDAGARATAAYLAGLVGVLLGDETEGALEVCRAIADGRAYGIAAIGGGGGRLMAEWRACPVLALAIRERRRRLYWAQRHLAHAAGLSRSLIAQYEAGNKAVTLENLERIARALGVRFGNVGVGYWQRGARYKQCCLHHAHSYLDARTVPAEDDDDLELVTLEDPSG